MRGSGLKERGEVVSQWRRRTWSQCTIALVILVGTGVEAFGQAVARPTPEELTATSERGKALNEYDQAAWHATDAVQMANPKTVEGQRYIAKKENGKWRVVFGRLNDTRDRFEISYKAVQQANTKEFAVQKEPAEGEDVSFFLYAARAIELAMKDFGGTSRPYNVAVLPGPADQLYVYLYPSQTKARVYPFGGDVRYLVSTDGTGIVEKRQMHKTILESAPAPATKKAGGYHTHFLSDVPEDSDVFHVLTQDPPTPEIVVTAHFMFKVETDGSIRVEKEKKK